MAERGEQGVRGVRGGQVREMGVSLPYLQEWRQQRLRTQKELADGAGVSRSTVANAERGARISAKAAQALAEALGATIEGLQHAPGEEE